MQDDLVSRTLDLPGGRIELLQPEVAAALPDDGEIEWAPIAPYWAVLWRSGTALARELDLVDIEGLRVLEIGCGLGLPSMVAARRGAEVLATDADPEAIEVLERNAEANGFELRATAWDWSDPGGSRIPSGAPFDLVLAADVLYEWASVKRLAALMPKLAPRLLLADPGRPAVTDFLDLVRVPGPAITEQRGVIRIHELDLTGG